MAQRREGFEDLDQLRNDHLGVLGGDGSDFLEKVKTQVTPEGISSRCSCTHCGHTNDVVVEYPEAVVVMGSLLPPDWEWDPKEKAVFPNVPCGNCRYQMKVLFTPSEMKRWVDTAIAQGVVRKETIGQLAMQVSQRAGAARR